MRPALKLAYIQAAWKEGFRWHPIGPFGTNEIRKQKHELLRCSEAIPHVTTEDQTVQGYWVTKMAVSSFPKHARVGGLEQM